MERLFALDSADGNLFGTGCSPGNLDWKKDNRPLHPLCANPDLMLTTTSLLVDESECACVWSMDSSVMSFASIQVALYLSISLSLYLSISLSRV